MSGQSVGHDVDELHVVIFYLFLFSGKGGVAKVD